MIQTTTSNFHSDMEEINLLNTPAKIVRLDPTVTFRLDKIVMNKAASRLLALKPKDRVGFSYDKPKLQLYIKIDPQGFFVEQWKSAYGFRSQALADKLNKMGIANGVYYLGEFSNGLWPLTWMK